MRRSSLVLVSSSLVAALLTGCGPDCESTCNRLFQPGDCNIVVPGEQQSEMLDQCMTACESALDNPGEIRQEYKPNDYPPANDGSQEPIVFTNDKEVALWMECVAETDCTLINDGICSPTTNFGQ